MVERAAREPTMEEIVGALRETRQDAGRLPPFTVVGDQPGGGWTSAVVLRGGEGRTMRLPGEVPNAHYDAGSIDIGELRESEIERLLSENARLNERIVFLLRVIEREQRRAFDPAGGQRDESAHGTIVHDVKAALEAEFRPVLLVLLRLLETQRAAAGPPAQVAPPRESNALDAADDIPPLEARRER